MANYRISRFTMKHGNRQDMPELLLGEPAFCKDTEELFIGNGIGKAPTKVGKIYEDQIKALEEKLMEAIELAKKTASVLETDILLNDNTLGKLTINSNGVSITDVQGNEKFTVDPTLTTFIDTLRVNNLIVSGNQSVMGVTRGYKDKLMTYYVSSSPKGKGDGTTKEDACSDFNTVADTIFKTYGFSCPATKIQIVLDPGVYTQDMSIPYFPGNIWEIVVQTDVNGTTTFTKPVNIYHSNTSIHFEGNSLGLMKFQSVAEGDSTAEESYNNHRRAMSVYGSNVNLEFTYCHWVTPITSEYEKHCIHVAKGSHNVQFSFNNCDFYGYDALLCKGDAHGEVLIYETVGDLTDWVVFNNYIPNVMGLHIYLYGKCPIVTNEPHSEITLHSKVADTPTHSSYYKTVVVDPDPGTPDPPEVVEPPTMVETTVNKQDRYTMESPGIKIYNWAAVFDPKYNPAGNPSQAIPISYGEISVADCLVQGSLAIADTSKNEIIYYHVYYGTWALSKSTLDYLHELGAKEKEGKITNLTAKLVFTQVFYYSTVSRPRIIYPAADIDIPNHMLTDRGYLVEQQGETTSDGRPTFVLELDGSHPLASTLKNDLFYSDSVKLKQASDGSLYYGIQIGDYSNKNHGRYLLDFVISYQEKVTVIG